MAYILQVNIHVKPDEIEKFKAASIENARKSTSEEPGCLRFDVVQQIDDLSRFMYIEVYQDSEAAGKHKESKHYNHWREVTEPLLAEPRTRVIYSGVFPGDAGWRHAV